MVDRVADRLQKAAKIMSGAFLALDGADPATTEALDGFAVLTAICTESSEKSAHGMSTESRIPSPSSHELYWMFCNPLH